MFLKQDQIDRIKWLFNTPTTELSTEEMFEQMNKEFGFNIPAQAWSMYLAHIGLNLQSRPRKVRPTETEKIKKEAKQTVFEFTNPDGTKVVVNLKTKEVTEEKVEEKTAYREPINSENVSSEKNEDKNSIEIEDVDFEEVNTSGDLEDGWLS